MTRNAEAPGGSARVRALFLGLLAVSVIAFLIPLELGPDAWFWRQVADLAHVFILAVLTFVLYFWLIRARPALAAAGWCVAGLSGFILLIEVLQPLTGRSASLRDLFAGLAGTFFALAFLLFNRTERTSAERNVSYLLAGLSGGLLFFLMEPVALGWRALQWRDDHFPVLSDFTTPHQQFLWESLPEGEPALALAPVGEGSDHLRVLRSQAPLSGVAYRAGLQDWSGFRRLELDLENPSDYPLELGLRIDDTGELSTLADRYQAALLLDPGRQTVVIPLPEIAAGPANRPLDLSQITRVVLFFGEPDPDDIYAALGEEPGEFRLWDARLVR